MRGRVEGLAKAEGGELDSIIFPHDYPCPEYARPRVPLGGGASGSVYPTKWLEIVTATKVIKVKGPEHETIIWKEAGILGGLNHPNIIKLFCCGFMRDNKQGKENEEFEIVTERGTMDLSHFLHQQTLFNEENAVDIMLQIASGMCYLHDMRVAHCDLKPDNVILTSNDSTSVEHVHVKLVDFGISKIEVTNSSNVPVGTPGYVAPEVFERSSKVDAFKSDVFSFGMVCSEIILRKRNFDGVLFRDYKHSILKGERPKLPQACSKGLKSLIHKCWSTEPSKRPVFLDILKTLRKLKNDSIFKTIHDVAAPEHFNEPTFLLSFIPHPRQWWGRLKYDFQGVLWVILFLWRMYMTLMRCLSQIKSKVWKLGSNTSLSRIEEESKITLSDQMLHEVNFTLSNFICKASWMCLDQ
jgi:serine/threonine protein kinase